MTPPFPDAAIRGWRIRQQQHDDAVRTLPWEQIQPFLISATAAYSGARSERLWEGQHLILHGPSSHPDGLEQFGLVVKLGRYIIGQPQLARLVRAHDRRCRRIPIARRVYTDAIRLRAWMAANRPTEPQWAPCCGPVAQHLAQLLGLTVVDHGGIAWACWGDRPLEVAR